SDICTAHQVHIALEEGVSSEMLTISSDAYGSRPIFDEEGKLIHISYMNSQVLYENFMSMIIEEKIPMEVALKFVSSNVAARMGLETQKGHLKAGYDADIIVMNPDLSIRDVLCKGREMMRNQELCSGYYRGPSGPL
ncbi:MAG: amidohydrolase family protein, partial [Prevotellaceae bacterium]|nr:amidohydrolase family protein [Prevotellaceae bacterium]